MLHFSPRHPRPIYIAAALLSVFLILTALYMQHSLGLDPCPLCILQRITVIALGLISLVAAVYNPQTYGRYIYASLLIIVSIIGLLLAGRHSWLQHLPEDQVPACGPSLEFMFEVFPLTEILSMILRGSGECAETQWTLLWLSIPEWMLIFFSVFLFIAFYLIKLERSHATG